MYIDHSGYFAGLAELLGFAVYAVAYVIVAVAVCVGLSETGVLDDFNTFTDEVVDDIFTSVEATIQEYNLRLTFALINVLTVTKKSGKEKSTKHPSYVNRGMIDKSLDAHQNAANMMNNKYGNNNWGKGPGSDYNQIVKWIVRGALLKEILINTSNNANNKYYIIYDYFGG